jgi:hypothetical protein
VPDLIPYTDALPSTRQSRQTSRTLARLEHQTRLRIAAVQAEGMVQSEKLREIDHLAREAMTGQALLRRWGDSLAAGDPFVADELKVFSDLARAAKAEIIADTVASYCREGRR